MTDWQPGRWYRINQPDGRVWCETSDREEIQREHEKTGWPIYRFWQRTDSEWRPE